MVSFHYRSIPLVLVLLSALVLIMQLSTPGYNHDSLHFSRESKAHDNSKIVAIYAGRSFHDEVACSMSCMYHQLGYTVVVYIESGIRLGNFIVPFTHVRLHESKAFYGRCVHRRIPITPQIRLVPNADVLVMITYPMKIAHHTLDPHAFSLLRQIKTGSYNTKLLLVTHHAKDRFWRHLPDIVRYIEPSRITFVFLAEHVYKHAQHLVANSSELPSVSATGVTVNPALPPAPQLAYIYPLMSRDLLFDTNQSDQFESMRQIAAPSSSQSSPAQLSFAIQGHFGSQHAKRRDLDGTIQCLHSLPGNSTKVATYSLRLIGKGEKGLPATLPGKHGTTAAPVAVQRLADLAPFDFYTEIAKSTFLLTATTAESYTTVQATSTLPIALLLHIPVVMPATLLDLYPCLRDAPVLRQLSGRTNCDALQRAVGMAGPQYAAVQEELRRCADTLWQDALSTVREISQ